MGFNYFLIENYLYMKHRLTYFRDDIFTLSNLPQDQSHNSILDKAMEVFSGVIPLHFNTIIKKTEASPKANLKKWLENEKGRLERYGAR